MASEKGTTLSATSAVVRNPLSVIAMFVLLVEAISTITLVQVVNNVGVAIPLVYFIVTFPTLVAILFFGTLWWKHQYLYSPMEYRSDESFLTAMDRLKRVEAKQEAADLNPLTADEHQSLAVVDRLLKLNDVRAAVKVGRTFLQARQYDIAARIFRHILEKTPPKHEDRYNAFANLAYSEIGLKQFDDAIDHMEGSIALAGEDRTGPWHYVALAYAHFRRSGGNQGEDLRRFKKYLDLAKKHEWFKYNSEFFQELYPEIADKI